MAEATPLWPKIQEARVILVKTRQILRQAQDDYAYAKTCAERDVIARVGGSEKFVGENAEARARNLLLAIESDESYTAARTALRLAQNDAELAELGVHTLTDQRREWEWRLVETSNDLSLGRMLSTMTHEPEA